jgi:hypothetical protein
LPVIGLRADQILIEPRKNIVDLFGFDSSH